MASPSLINIAQRARLHEPGYRYQRDRISVVHENFKGNVTRIVNAKTLSKQLQIHIEELERGLEKCIKRKLGISTCGSLTFPGTLQMVDLDDVLQGMIEQYVLCPTCHLPEWNRRNCNACGHSKTKTDTTTTNGATTHVQTFEIETDYGPVPEWERRLSEQMDRLYEIRPTQNEEEQKRIDLLLNACWVADTPLLAKKVTKVFDKHYTNKVKV